MTTLTDLRRQDLRRTILDVLATDAAHSISDLLLRAAAEEAGCRAALDEVRAEMTWLAGRGYVCRTDEGGTWMVRLTERGLDVAAGRITPDGVRRPYLDD